MDKIDLLEKIRKVVAKEEKLDYFEILSVLEIAKLEFWESLRVSEEYGEDDVEEEENPKSNTLPDSKQQDYLSSRRRDVMFG